MSTAGEWTSLEKLLLAQSVYKLGEDNWTQVARNLNQSTLLDRQPDFFNREECFEQYSRLVNSVGNTEKQPDSAAGNTDGFPPVVQIAKILHIQRLEELRRAIEETNEKYAMLTNEIDAIRLGKWDERLITEATKNQAAIAVPGRTEPIIPDDDAIKAIEVEPLQVDDSMVTEASQPEEESVRSQPPQEEKQLPQEEKMVTPVSPGISTTPLSMLDNGSAVNTPLEQGPATPAEAVVNTPPYPPPQPRLPAVATLAGPIATATAETGVSLANDVAAIMDRIENAPYGPAPAAEARQPETAVVQSIVEEPTPKEVLEAAPEPHVTWRPMVSSQVQDDRQESEESFHPAATEMELKIKSEELQREQQQFGPPSPSGAPALSPLQPLVPEEPLAEADPTTHVISAEEALDTGEVNRDIGLKRKAEEDTGAAPGEVEQHEIKRQRTGDDVTQEISAETVLAKVNETEPMVNIDHLPPATATARTLHQDPDEESRSPDAVYPRSPEAPLSMTSGADAESVTGSESNAPTPTGSAPSSETKRTGSSSGRSKDEQRQQKSWQKNINLLWREITNHKNGAMFMNPIKEATAPSYYDIVKHPMDLKAIKNRIRDGVIKSTVEFERDIVLMLTNSLMYNKEGTEMYQMAVEMLDDVTEQMKLFKTADSNSPPVSHTRKASTIAKDRRKSISDF